MRPECGSSAPRCGRAHPPARGVGLPAHGTGARVTPSCPAGTRVLSFFFPFLLNHERGLKFIRLFFFSVRLAKRLRGFLPSRAQAARRIRQSSSAARPRAPGSSGIAAFSRCRARRAVVSRGFASPLAAGSRAARCPLTSPLSGAGVRSRPPRVPLSLGFAHRRSGRAVRSCR